MLKSVLCWTLVVIFFSIAVIGLSGGLVGLIDHLSTLHGASCSLTLHFIIMAIGIVGFVLFWFTLLKMGNRKA